MPVQSSAYMLQASLHAKRFGVGVYVLRRGTRDYAHGAMFLILTGMARLQLFGKPGFDWERQAPAEPRCAPRGNCCCGCGAVGHLTLGPTLLVIGLASVVVVFSLLPFVSLRLDRDSCLTNCPRLAWLKVSWH